MLFCEVEAMVLREGFGAQAGPPGGPQRPENSQKPTMQNPGNLILRKSAGRSAPTSPDFKLARLLSRMADTRLLTKHCEAPLWNAQFKLPHNSGILKVTWADILRGRSYGPARGFWSPSQASKGPPEARKQPKTNHAKSWKSDSQNVNGPLGPNFA